MLLCALIVHSFYCWVVFQYMAYNSLFIHSSADEHLGHFHLFAEQSCHIHSCVSPCMDTGFIYSYDFPYIPRRPKSNLPDTNNQMPVQQVHLHNPKGLSNKHVQNSPYYATLAIPTAGSPPTVSILTKSIQSKNLRLFLLSSLSLPPITQWVTRSCQFCLLNISQIKSIPTFPS